MVKTAYRKQVYATRETLNVVIKDEQRLREYWIRYHDDKIVYNVFHVYSGQFLYSFTDYWK